jgi:hypothetical protein
MAQEPLQATMSHFILTLYAHLPLQVLRSYRTSGTAQGHWMLVVIGHISIMGFESAEAKHTGTYGLDASGMRKNDKIWFNNPSSTVDGNIYDALVMWVNIKEWQANKDITVELHTLGGKNVEVNLGRYLTKDALNVWQKVSIPMTHFGNTGSFNIDRLRLWPSGNIGLWLDDIYFSMGAVIGIPVCDPDVYGEEFGKKTITADEISPSVKAEGTTTSITATYTDFVPNVKAKENKPNIKAFSAAKCFLRRE